MNKEEIIELIESIRIKPGIKLQLNNLAKEVLYEVAKHYQLNVFSPEIHPMDFYFVKGYYDQGGIVRNFKRDPSNPERTAAGSFSLTTNTDFPELMYL